MAGYLMVLGDIKDENQRIVATAEEIYKQCCTTGTYSTRLVIKEDMKKGKWASTKESTYTDYLGMKAGDYIFFFFERKIYGIGKLRNIGQDCKYWSYLGANRPVVFAESDIRGTRLFEAIQPENRCVCFFAPEPQYYEIPVDMDEALMAYPSAFKSLRVIQGRSFIKMDDEESLALAALLIKKNQNHTNTEGRIEFDPSIHERVEQRVCHTNEYDFTVNSILRCYRPDDTGAISSEQMIEAALIEHLTKGSESSLWGHWDYICHQVSASPAKPVEYMEHMDVFGYRKSKEIDRMGIPIQFAVEKYFVVEIKRGSLCLSQKGKKMQAIKGVASQLMKYVDWVTKMYASGAYPMVQAYIIANGFDKEFIEYCRKTCVRNFNQGYRDAIPTTWNDVLLIQYKFDDGGISFEQVDFD